jgi:hypothetical protein
MGLARRGCNWRCPDVSALLLGFFVPRRPETRLGGLSGSFQTAGDPGEPKGNGAASRFPFPLPDAIIANKKRKSNSVSDLSGLSALIGITSTRISQGSQDRCSLFVPYVLCLWSLGHISPQPKKSTCTQTKLQFPRYQFICLARHLPGIQSSNGDGQALENIVALEGVGAIWRSF